MYSQNMKGHPDQDLIIIKQVISIGTAGNIFRKQTFNKISWTKENVSVYSASSLNLQSICRFVDQLGCIILIPSKPVFALTLQ